MANELICDCRAHLASGFQLDARMTIPLDAGVVTVVFGPSGAGKTTLLRVLAGLERPAEGAISFRGDTWFDSQRGVALAPQQRRAGFLFRDYALFPHLNVAENVAFAARKGGREYLKGFGLADLARRKPQEISSGQQQRVALARALAAEPALLLLDEPLSALDAATRARTRQQLRYMLVSSRVPALVVTHDRMEAVALGDWIAVMSEGSILQVGPVREVFQRPAHARVAESAGIENVLSAQVAERQSGLVTVTVGAVRLQAVDGGEECAVAACIRGEDVAITRDTPEHSSIRNRVPGRIVELAIDGPLARVDLDCGFPLVAVITAESAEELGLRAGDRVIAAVKTTSVHLAAL
jgi:molybdate transport system ATP-binding protein